MHAVRLYSKTMEEYLLKIKSYVELVGVGVPVCHEEYVDVILEELSFGYELIVLILKVKSVHCQLLKLKLFFVVMKQILACDVKFSISFIELYSSLVW